jgi:hypothetical protein
VLAHLDGPIGDRAEAHAFEADHRMADGVTHVPHLPCAPLMQGDRHERLITACPQGGVDDPDDGRRGPPARDGHPAPQALERVLVRHAAHPRVVLALDLVTRMQEPRRQLPVVGEQQHPLGVVVEPAHRVDVLAHVRQQVEHGRPVLRVAPRRHVATRLVEQDVAVPRSRAHTLAVDPDVVVRGVGPRAQLENRDAVHRHPSVQDERFRGAPRRDAGRGEDLLEAVAGWWWGDHGSPVRRQKQEELPAARLRESRIPSPDTTSAEGWRRSPPAPKSPTCPAPSSAPRA